MAGEDEFDEIPDLFEEETKKPKKIKYPKCYVDTKHDGDPICKVCALELYEILPKKKFNYPRNCWNCIEIGNVPEDSSEPYYE